MYAVVSSGGKQYRVEPGSTVLVERLPSEPGAAILFDRVLLIGDGDDGDGRHARSCPAPPSAARSWARSLGQSS